MSVLKLVLAPSLILKNKSELINNINKPISQLANNMFETMYKYGGVGLSAPQVSQSLQLIVIDCSGKDRKFTPSTIINPKIINLSTGFSVNDEGCLSFPDQFYEIKRPNSALVKYIDIHGKPITKKFSDFEAVCIQHEIDHLKGTLFVDYMSKLRRTMILKKMIKYKKNLLIKEKLTI